MKAQVELLKVQWNGGVDFHATKARIVDGLITNHKNESWGRIILQAVA